MKNRRRAKESYGGFYFKLSTLTRPKLRKAAGEKRHFKNIIKKPNILYKLDVDKLY